MTYESPKALRMVLAVDRFNDSFILRSGKVARLMEDGAGHFTWRSKVEAFLSGKPFGTVQLDISPRLYELDRTDQIPLPNSLAFAGIESSRIEVIDVNRHAAEKLHAMQKDFGDRENSRVRDLVDLMIFLNHELLDLAVLAEMVIQVWREREDKDPPLSKQGSFGLRCFINKKPQKFTCIYATCINACKLLACILLVAALN